MFLERQRTLERGRASRRRERKLQTEKALAPGLSKRMDIGLQAISNPQSTIRMHSKRQTNKDRKALTYDACFCKMAKIAGHEKQNDQKQQLDFHCKRFFVFFSQKSTKKTKDYTTRIHDQFSMRDLI